MSKADDDRVDPFFHWGNWAADRARFLKLKRGDLARRVGTVRHNLSRWLKADDMPPLRPTYRRTLAAALKVEGESLPYIHMFALPDWPGVLSIPRRTIGEAGRHAVVRLQGGHPALPSGALALPGIDRWLRELIQTKVGQLRGEDLLKVCIALADVMERAAEQKGTDGPTLQDRRHTKRKPTRPARRAGAGPQDDD